MKAKPLRKGGKFWKGKTEKATEVCQSISESRDIAVSHAVTHAWITEPKDSTSSLRWVGMLAEDNTHLTPLRPLNPIPREFYKPGIGNSVPMPRQHMADAHQNSLRLRMKRTLTFVKPGLILLGANRSIRVPKCTTALTSVRLPLWEFDTRACLARPFGNKHKAFTNRRVEN